MSRGMELGLALIAGMSTLPHDVTKALGAVPRLLGARTACGNS